MASSHGSPTRLGYLPALDGLRGLAVIGVLLFHGGFTWAKGGFLGVSMFFTLSGFLITSLLLREHAERHTISLRDFWTRRFRRLLPAAIVVLALVSVVYAPVWASPEQLGDLRADVLAALGYVANWRFVLADKQYSDLFSAPSPVQHFWSLAIEEQFYVIYPVLVAVALRVGGRRALGFALASLAVGSVALSFVLSSSFDRVYYGTDTRAFELLAGALFALWWNRPGRRDLHPHVRNTVGTAALVGSLVVWTQVGQTSTRLAEGGFALQALATVGLLLAVTAPSAVGRVLSIAPLRAVGLVSYGLYLFHWPVFLVLDETRIGWGQWPLFGVRMAATGALTVVSYYVVEQPIRRGRALRSRAVLVATPAALLAVVVAAVVVTWDPPPSQVAFANQDIGVFDPRVVPVGPTSTTAPPVAAGSPSTTGSPPGGSPSTTRTVMFLGDSGMNDLEPALGEAFGAGGATQAVWAAGPGFGLSSMTDTWRTLWPELVDTNDPDVIVVMLGGWDVRYLESEGPAKYSALIDEALDVLTADGASVLWLAMMAGGTGADRTEVNQVFQQVIAGRGPDVMFYDPESALADPVRGGYPRSITVNGVSLLLRKPDQWHLCPDGAARLAADIQQFAVGRGWSDPAADGWQDGPWRDLPNYDDPVGACDTQ